MNGDDIKMRLAQLMAQREDMIAQLNACMGAIQDCQYWLSKLAEAGTINEADPSNGPKEE